jgi:23S rRNA (guanine745-N1)-methyltransferase
VPGAWDVFRLFPLAGAVADVVLHVFAPRNPAEFHRVLRPAGWSSSVPPVGIWPNCVAGSLRWSRSTRARNNACYRALDPFFGAAVTEQVVYSVPLTRREALDLVGMTPSTRHLSRADMDGDGLLPDEVTVSVLVTAYQPR